MPVTVFMVCGLLLVTVALEHYLRRSTFPPVCWLMVAGVVFGLLRHHTELSLPSFHVGPEVVLFVFLPLLIFNSSRKLSLSEIRSILPEAGLLALVGPLAGMFLLGWSLHVITGIPLQDGLLFGAIIAATDPVAVTAIFENFSVPDRLRTMVEGESLLNDGVTVVLFTVLLARITSDSVFSLPGTVGWFVVSVLGALVLGVIAGGIGGFLLRWWHEQHDRFIGALLPLITVYASFAVAEHLLRFSGVLAVISTTLTLGVLHIHRGKRSQEADQFFDDFWNFLHQLVIAVLFFIVGARMGEHAWRLSLWIIPVMIGIMLLARAISVYGGMALIGGTYRKTRLKWQHVLNIGGLRGALSVALILTLSSDYAHRNLFLCLAFALIFFTVIVNTLGVRFYVGRILQQERTVENTKGGPDE